MNEYGKLTTVATRVCKQQLD